MKVSEDVKEDEDIHDQVYEEDAEEASREGDKPIYEKDEEGNIIICEVYIIHNLLFSFIDFRGRSMSSTMQSTDKEIEPACINLWGVQTQIRFVILDWPH